LLPLLSIQCMSRRDLSVKGGTSERCYRMRRGRTNEGAECHNKPVFWRAYKNERPISWNYEYIIFGQIIFQNFHQFKAFVGLSDYRTVGLSDCRIIATVPLKIGWFFYVLLQNIITLVFCKLTFNFQWWQYFSNIVKEYCISASVSERIIVSSAYSNEKSFTNIFKFSEYIFLIFSKSFKLKIWFNPPFL
jgi:hypothetical protein